MYRTQHLPNNRDRFFTNPGATYLESCSPGLIHGEGAYLVDAEGQRYLDCQSVGRVLNAGHANPEILDAVNDALRLPQQVSWTCANEAASALERGIVERTAPPLRRMFFCGSGSEANEGALLLAIRATRRTQCAYLREGWHGQTKLARSVSGIERWRTDPPLLMTHAIPGPCHPESLRVLESVLRRETIAALIAEPVQAEGGIVVPPEHYWPELRRLCTRYGTLLIADEVQTAWNRTGTWFATKHWDVVPDILTVGSALANGLPIAGYFTSEAIAPHAASQATNSFSNPLDPYRAALATLGYHQRHRLGERSTILGTKLRKALRELQRRHPVIDEVRGLGLMIGVELRDYTGLPAIALANTVLEQMRDAGFLLGKSGLARNVLTLMPPLTVESDDLDALVAQLDHVLTCAV